MAVLAVFLVSGCDKDDPLPTETTKDTEAPTVQLTAPDDGFTMLQGTMVTLTAEASDNVGVERVDFMLNGKVINSDEIPPFETIWVTNKQTFPGSYFLSARAVDKAENMGQSDTITVIVFD